MLDLLIKKKHVSLKLWLAFYSMILLISPYRNNAVEALQKLNGTVIGKQTVRLSWSRNPANEQVLGRTSRPSPPPLPPKGKENDTTTPFSLHLLLGLEKSFFEDLMDNSDFTMHLALTELFEVIPSCWKLGRVIDQFCMNDCSFKF